MNHLCAIFFHFCVVAGLSITEKRARYPAIDENVLPRATCENTATSRSCWGEYDINTDYYDVIPETGVTREYWLVAQNITAAPDGYQRQILAFNGTVPGPTIEANWGDNIIVHVTNEIADNGTAVHWHGIRQLFNNEYDGVPGVTQCPIAPGESLTYKFRAQQYGTTWYHSHFSVQTVDGLSGPIIIHGPATANYDEHLGALFLTDWSHDTSFETWKNTEKNGLFPIIPNGLINGTNTFDCTGSSDAACLGTGKRFELSFTPGKKYRIGLVGAQTDGFLRFAIDGHNLTVIANDLVPVVPYITDSVVLGGGQRYDIIVEASQAVDNYWMRSVVGGCNLIINTNWDNIRGIVRYEGVVDFTADPTTASSISNNCYDESLASLVPHLNKTVGSATSEESLDVTWYYDILGGLVYHWTINSQTLEIDWAEPTLRLIENGVAVFPTDYNVKEITAVNQVCILSLPPLEQKKMANIGKWVYFIIQDLSLLDANHPIHLHGHDFYILAQGSGIFVEGAIPLNLNNPPRRDTAILPGNGFLILGFYTDNPGTWLMHCHILWHASQGFALQFVERESEIAATIHDSQALNNTCASWDTYVLTEQYEQDDSGI
ncbi:related to Laccase-2 [Phialocephala subalpina]|uniref:laccase n=1 Tax=Phialocephala subalpina TaxID=576137 RepID=A0A1L7XWD1_9HELO|nr:related to Laccase-2 [Phialocephala subalpina]